MSRCKTLGALAPLLVIACTDSGKAGTGGSGGTSGGASGAAGSPLPVDVGQPDSGQPDGGGAGGSSGDAGASPPRAPNGYIVQGNRILDASNQPVRLRGVALPSLIWDATGSVITAEDTTLMAAWGVEVVRIGLNQDFWLNGTAGCDASCYKGHVARVVTLARGAGIDVILDLHWATANGAVQPQFMEMADPLSVQFWSEVAAAYRDDGRVLFELYNEPHDIDWQTWQRGGTVSGFYDPDTSDTDYARSVPITYEAAGMQALYDAVRASRAHNLVIVGGLDWSFDASGVPSYPLQGYNIAYATHLYPFPNKLPEFWEQAFGFLTSSVPLLVTEFAPGSTADPNCPEDFAGAVIAYTDAAQLSWVAWDWFASGSPSDPLARCNSSHFFQETNPAAPIYAPTPFGERIRTELSR